MNFIKEHAILALALILGSIFWLYVISIFLDEPLRPEVKEAMEWNLPSSAYEENGYLILLGMNEPAGVDALTAGKIILENELQRYQAYKLNQDMAPSKPYSSTDSLFSMKDSLCDYQKQINCVAFYLAQNHATRQQLLKKNQFLLERYRSIRNSRQFVETIPPYPEALIPSYTNLTSAAKLEHVLVISDISRRRFAAAMDRLAENAAFAHRLLKEGDSLIAHMIALHMVKNDALILSALMQKYPQLVQYTAQISQIVAPISTREYSEEKAFKREQRNILNLIGHTRTEIIENWKRKGQGYLNGLLKLFYSENATLNLAYDLYNLKVKVASADGSQLDLEVANADRESENLYGTPIISHMIYVRNTGGKLLLQISEPSYLDYVIRHHDTEGFLRLVALQYKLLAQKIGLTHVPRFLELAGREYVNPYTLEPMKWNADKRELSFEGRQADKNNPGKKVRYCAYLP